VIDNYAQWFTVVPGALNLVQGPTNYHNFLKMGIPPSQLQLAGHWIPKELVENMRTFPQHASGGSNDGSTANRCAC
jgi:hypothetical protein